MEGMGVELAAEVAKIATKDKMAAKVKANVLKTLIICLTVLLCVTLICASSIAKYYIDKNYEYLEGLIIETETITETRVEQDTEDGGSNYYQGGSNNENMIGGGLGGEADSYNNKN